MYCNDQLNPFLRQLLSLFPYEPPRPVQKEALRIIARMFDEGNHFSIIEAPTGAGKSALAFTAARIGATLDDGDFSPGAYILTPHNNLADRMTSDFGHLGLANLKASRHYDPAASGNCNEDTCTYEKAKARFLKTPLGVTNYAYFLRARQMPERQVLILDEGHNLERILLDMEGFSITSQNCAAAGVDAPRLFGPHEQERIVSWLGAVFLPAMRKRPGRYGESPTQREWENLVERVARYIDMEDRSQWVAWSEEGVLSAKPLSVVAPARELFARARHVILQSATILDLATFQRILGIPDDALTFSAPSDFPLHNRPIIYTPIGDMSHRAKERTIPHLCTHIARIVSDFSQSKGVVHTHAYDINQRVFQHLIGKFGSRIISHGRDARDREDAIRRHCASNEASVLVSPSLNEGVDLKDDLARFQIVCKVPYRRLDAYTRARSARDSSWYDLQTAWALIQTIGRGVRSETDSANTFVLDSQFEKFVTRSERILPAWWRAAIQTVAKVA
ncbi:MAG: helicase C-terminal domain-containing protein [Terracidiphilus sp.]